MPAVPGMQPPVQALCLAPFGMEEGTEAALSALEFGLVVGEQVRFRFFGSSVRRQDEVGTLLEDWEPDELQELDEIQTTLPSDGRAAGEVVRVRLHARVTEAGTLELEALAARRTAALESGVRRARRRERLIPGSCCRGPSGPRQHEQVAGVWRWACSFAWLAG
jgi:hypothetical protein